MLIIVGYLVILGAILGGFAGGGGSLAILFQPFEIIIIIGGAVGAFVCGNSMPILKGVLSQSIGTLKYASFDKDFYLELLASFKTLTKKIRKESLLSLEEIIDSDEIESIFTAKIFNHHHLMEFIRDNLRLIVTGIEPRPLNELMDQGLETYLEESQGIIKAAKGFGDCLPAFGIVAAVLSVVHAMDSVGLPPEEIGKLIAAALVGTFLGIVLAYGFILPVSNVIESRLEASFYAHKCAQKGLLCCVQGISPVKTVEYMRMVIPSDVRPSFTELDEQLLSVNDGPAGRSEKSDKTKINKMMETLQKFSDF